MKKTFHGLGTIRHKKGRLKPFEFYSKGYYTEQGQYKQDFIKSFTTLKEAELFRLEYYNNNTDKKIEPTFLEVARLFLEEYAQDKKASTTLNLKRYLNKLTRLYNIKITDITLLQLQNFLDTAELTKGTKRNYKSFFKQIFDFACVHGYIEKHNIQALKINFEHVERKRLHEKVFTSAELEKIKDLAFKKDFVASILFVLVCTGLRISELINLEIKDINLQERFFLVAGGKTINAKRLVPISQAILDIVKHNTEQNKKFLFEYKGKKLVYSTFNIAFKKFLELHNIQKHNIHDTRHTFASLLSGSTQDTDAVIKMIGHSNYKITQNTYIHKDIKKLLDIVDTMGI